MQTRLMSAILVAVLCPMLCQAQSISAGPLPPPIVTHNSLETCLNSRYSQHSLSRTAASSQQLSNVLWAAGRAPVTGAYRSIYVATGDGTYLYDPNSHSLSRYSNEVTNDGSFAIVYDAQLPFDAGVMFMPALLASVSLCNSSQPALACCPKGLGLPKTRLFFGVQAGTGLTTTLAAHCSVAQGQAGWLPDPSTMADNSLEEVLGHLNYGNRFEQVNLTIQQLSQILWAGYGCSAHTTTNSKAGLTVPSAYANYYLTQGLFVVKEDGVYRYLNRKPGLSTSTKDHRLELVAAAPSTGGRSPTDQGDEASPADPRIALRSAVGTLPQAPCYVVLCLDSANAGQEFAQLETGFVAGNMLMQATVVGLGCHFTSKLTAAEQKAVRAATSIPAAQIPQVIISIGPPAAAMTVSVALQGERRPEAGWTIPLTVRLFTPGANMLTDVPAYEFKSMAVRSAAGDRAVCEIPVVTPGLYDIVVFGESTLMNVRRSVAIRASVASVDMGTLLEGNANQDDAVDLGDCVILAACWRTSPQQGSYDPRADFDRTGLIDADDLLLLAANWLENSPVEIQP
jgi:hypothetical protein